MSGQGTAADLVLEMARRYDRERLLACLFTPPGVRPRLAALVLLHAELARIPGLVREPMAGLVRYQWWRERILATAEGAAAEHPALAVLATDLREERVAAGELLALVDAGEAFFEAALPPAVDGLEEHARRTSGHLQGLVARLLGRDAAAIGAAETVGTAYGLAGLLRAAPRLARDGTAVLPEAGTAAREVRIAEISERARRRLQEPDLRAWRRLDGPSRLIARMTWRTLRALARVGGEPMRLPPGGDPLLPLRLLLWQRWRGKPPGPRGRLSPRPGSS